MSKAGFIRTSILMSAIFALEIACRAGALPANAIVPPTEMIESMFATLASGALNNDLRLTLTAVLSATILSIVGGFLIALLIHGIPRLRHALDPLFATYYAIPHVAFYPLLIVTFGLGIGPLIVLATLVGIVAMIIATLNGLDHVPRVLIRTGQLMQLSRRHEMLLIRLPAASPYLLSGVKLAFSYAFIGVIAGEFILSTAGVGHAISFAYDNFENRKMYGLILLVIGFVTLVNTLILVAEKRMMVKRGTR